jgi:excisionase family DNA binding protein
MSRSRSSIEPNRVVLTLDEAASCLGVHRQSVRAAIERGELRAVRMGRRWLVPVAAIERLLDGEHVAPGGNAS